jgi:hypothetical protein
MIRYCTSCRINFTPGGLPIYAELQERNGFAVCPCCNGCYGRWEEPPPENRPVDLHCELRCNLRVNCPEGLAILRDLPMYPPVPAEVPWPFYSGDQLARFAVEAVMEDRQRRHIAKPVAYMAYGVEHNVFLAEYAGSTEDEVKRKVMIKARHEGYEDTPTARLAELGWEIRPVYAPEKKP